MKKGMEDLIEYRLDRAFETLKEAEAMISNQFWNAAINRIFYACFYAVNALLLKKGIDASTHKGIRQMLGLHFVQTGLLSKEQARYFSDLYDRRQTGDYDDFISYDKETAVVIFEKAKDFISAIKRLLQELDE
jgi:uncharacterized protein (UPF0332 family)